MWLHGCLQRVQYGKGIIQTPRDPRLPVTTAWHRARCRAQHGAKLASASTVNDHRISSVAAVAKGATTLVTALLLTIAASLPLEASASSDGQGALQLSSTSTPSGVIPIDAEDENDVLTNLLYEAMSYISGSSGTGQNPDTAKPVNPDNGKDLLAKLREEQDRLKKQSIEEQKAKKEREIARQEALERAKAEAELKKAQEEERKKAEAARKAAEEAAMKKIRDEEAAKHAREVEARKEAEQRMKEERDMRLHAERERQESERLRQLEGAQRRRDQVLAAAGGASVGVVVSIASEVFRSIGGPTIIAMALRTPGLVVGKQLRLVEWDIQDSPREPDGACVCITLRAGQLSRQGLRSEIAKTYGLEGPKLVKQFRHCHVFGVRVFYEQLDSTQAIKQLDDGAMVVWTRVSPSQLTMPSRNDRLPSHTDAGVNVEIAAMRAEQTATKYLKRIATATAVVCSISRGEVPLEVDSGSATVPDAGQGHSTSGQSENGTAHTHESPGKDKVATAPVLSCSWLLSQGKKVSQGSEVQKQLSQLGEISLEDEGRIVACIFNSDKVVLELFECFAHDNIFHFVSYAHAHVEQLRCRPDSE